MMSDGQYWVDPDEVDGAVGRLTAEALDIYNLARELNDMRQPSFSKAGADFADAFAYVRQRLAESLRETAQQMQETNMAVSQGMRDYRNSDVDAATEFRNAGGWTP